MKLRIGAVAYLNSKPLIHNLHDFLPEGSQLLLDIPSRLADMLEHRQIDIGLIPSIEYFEDARYGIYSDACIACRGSVLSVKIFFRVPPHKVRSLAIDAGSRTSVALARILLAERFGVQPVCQPLPMDADVRACPQDAVLLIGDRAMKRPEIAYQEEWDLGEEWMRGTGLPFVFAMWVGLHNQLPQEIHAALGRARDSGIAAIDSIARAESARNGLSVTTCEAYLKSHLRFTLGEEELEGLNLFYRKASALGLAPSNRESMVTTTASL